MFPSVRKPHLVFSRRFMVVSRCVRDALTDAPTGQLIRFRWSEVTVHRDLFSTEPTRGSVAGAVDPYRSDRDRM